MSYKIVSDSSSNIFEYSHCEYQSVPLTITTSQMDYVDQKGVDVKGMVDYLQTANEKINTSCPSIGQWTNAFSIVDELYLVTISGNLSGSFNSAMQAAAEYQQLYPNVKIKVFDSIGTGPSLELIIEKIVELKKKGFSFELVSELVDDFIHNHMHIFFVLQSVKNLANNGRISHLIASIVGILNIRMLGMGSEIGTINMVGKQKGDKKIFKMMLEEMIKHGFNGGKVRISHTYNEEASKMITDLILEKFPDCDVTSRLTTALCSFYAEKGGLILSFEK